MEHEAVAKQTFRRLLTEFKKIQAAMNSGKAPYLLRCEPMDNNLMKWQVEMKFRPDSLLQQSLDRLSEALFDESQDKLTLEVHFPPEFPNAPPEVWLRRPWLKYKSAFPVTFSGRVCSDVLASTGWMPTIDTLVVLMDVQELLVEAGGEVDVVVSVKTPHYPQAPPMLHRTQTAYFPSANHFKRDRMLAISGIEAASFYGDAVCQFETSDRIGLPSNLAREIYEHAERTGAELDLPLMFEVKTSRGRKRHCTIKDFGAELPDDVVVMPKWVMDDLFIAEREIVRVRGVQLPLIQSVQIQPHDVKFYEAMAEMKRCGHDDVKILNDAIAGFSALTEDTSIFIKIGSTSHKVQILHLEPKAAVRIIDQDMESSFEVRVQLMESPDLEGDAAAEARLSQILERRKRKRDQKTADDIAIRERRVAARRTQFEKNRDQMQRVAGADTGEEGEVEVMVRLPGGGRFIGKFPEGAPIEALEASVLRSDWADQCSPWGVQLVSSFPRKVFTTGHLITKDMHRAAINVQLVLPPDDDEELFKISAVVKNSVHADAGKLTQLDFDEVALEQSTNFWFRVQCFLQKGITLEEAKQRAEAGEHVSITTGNALSPPSLKRSRTAIEATRPQVQEVMKCTALDSVAATALLEDYDWNTQRAVNAFLDANVQ